MKMVSPLLTANAWLSGVPGTAAAERLRRWNRLASRQQCTVDTVFDRVPFVCTNHSNIFVNGFPTPCYRVWRRRSAQHGARYRAGGCHGAWLNGRRLPGQFAAPCTVYLSCMHVVHALTFQPVCDVFRCLPSGTATESLSDSPTLQPRPRRRKMFCSRPSGCVSVHGFTC